MNFINYFEVWYFSAPSLSHFTNASTFSSYTRAGIIGAPSLFRIT